MCVIAYSPKGTDIPTDEQLEQMWDANHDGAGFAYIRRGKVHYKKGFLTLAALKSALGDHAQYKNTEFAIHFRIGTAGKNDQYTTHPFPVSTRYQDLRRTEGRTNAVLFHNGVLSDGGAVDPHSSDTQDFVVAFAPLLRKYTHSHARDTFISDFTANNRLLILYGDGHVKMYGNWERDGDLLVSNTYYKPTTYSTYPSAHDSHTWWDDWYHSVALDAVDTRALWDTIISQGWAEVTPLQLRALKRSADDYTLTHIIYSGTTFEYDAESGVVWLASLTD